jgi:ubiquinone/menaquinone biosynthesis C-methylase UbiE/aryl carrier-like protein
MNKSGSYDVASFSTSMKAEIQRLNAQVDLFWDVEYAMLKRYGLRNGIDMLDCGCGPGRLIELLKGEMPGLKITGLEMDHQLVDAARSMIAARGLSGCSILEGTAEQPGLADASFDFIVMRLVLEHVPDPLLALRSLGRLLRTGGRLVVISNDFEFHLRTWPPVPQLEILYEAYRASRRKDGGDPCIGRRVPRLLEQAGFKLTGNEIELAHNALSGDKPFLKAEGAGIPAQLVSTGFLDKGALEAMTRSWRAMLTEPGHIIMRLLFVAAGEISMEPEGLLSGEYKSETGSKFGAAAISKAAPEEDGLAGGGTLPVLIGLVTEVLKEKLKEAGNAVILPGDLLVDIGLDSLAALDLQERIKSVTGIEVPLEKLLENISLKALAEHIDSESAGKGLKPDKAEVQGVQEKPESWEEGEI